MEKAPSQNGTLSYYHQDNLSSTSLMTDSSGIQVGATVKYLPFGNCLQNPDLPTDKLFTGQRLDATGLYYYNARYYDPTIGRFISPDTFVQWINELGFVSYQLTVDVVRLGFGSVRNIQVTYPQPIFAVPMYPQVLNKYSYVINNSLKYTDPTGFINWGKLIGRIVVIIAWDLGVESLAIVALLGTIIFVPEVLPAMLWVEAGISAIGIGVNSLGIKLINEGKNENGTPELPLEKKPIVNTPSKTNPFFSVAFSDGSSGYYTAEQISMIQQYNVGVQNMSTIPNTKITFSDGSSGYYTNEQISAMAQYGIQYTA
jgi:RHS repeat-associated protein